jgi:hypothetical protein
MKTTNTSQSLQSPQLNYAKFNILAMWLLIRLGNHIYRWIRAFAVTWEPRALK